MSGKSKRLHAEFISPLHRAEAKGTRCPNRSIIDGDNLNIIRYIYNRIEE